MKTIERLRKLAEEATRGPWEYIYYTVYAPTDPSREITDASEVERPIADAVEMDDACLIAAMHRTLPLLLDVAEKARRMLDNMGTMDVGSSGVASVPREEDVAELEDALARLEGVGS